MGGARLNRQARPRTVELIREKVDQRVVRLAIDGRRIDRNLQAAAEHTDDGSVLRPGAGVHENQHGGTGLPNPFCGERTDLRARIVVGDRLARLAPARS